MLWTVVALGAMVRLRIYLACRSLWSDEAMLALNVIRRPLASLLTRRLDYQQAAPPGFLLLEKGCLLLFGASEYSLRLPALLSGILSIGLTYLLARKFTPFWPALLAAALVAFSKGLIEQSVFVKQYETDVATALLVLLTSIPLLRQTQLARSSLCIFSISCALAIWCSHAAVFVVVGASAALLIRQLMKKQWGGVAWICLAGAPAAISLGVEYYFILRSLEGSAYLHNFWIGGFLPLPLRFGKTIQWFLTVPVLLMASPGGFKLWGIAPICFLLGLFSLWRRDKAALLLLTAPIVIVMMAAALQKYPFTRSAGAFRITNAADHQLDRRLFIIR